MATRFLHGMKFFEQLWKPFTKEINPAKFGWNSTSGFSQGDFLSSLYNL
jgi:hypothetical protein